MDSQSQRLPIPSAEAVAVIAMQTCRRAWWLVATVWFSLRPRVRFLAGIQTCGLAIWLIAPAFTAPAGIPVVALPHTLPALAVHDPRPPPAAPVAAAVMADAAEVNDELPAQAPAEAAPRVAPRRWAPQRIAFERAPADFLRLPDEQPRLIRVVTIRARVTAYTAYDHAITEPHWADGIVAWHPDGRKRRVSAHPYGLATDWTQFPPGATFINVPGYLERSAPGDFQRFRVVDDACGRSRSARRNGAMPVIDVRFQQRSSAIGSRDAWGSKVLAVEVIYPSGFEIPSSLRRWVISEEWRLAEGGEWQRPASAE